MSRNKTREFSGYYKVEIVLEHHLHKTMSIYTVELPVGHQVILLKEDMEPRFHVPPEEQVWFFKGKQLADTDKLQNLGIRRGDIVFVKQIGKKQLHLDSDCSSSSSSHQAFPMRM